MKDINIFKPYKIRMSFYYGDQTAVKPSESFITNVAKTMKEQYTKAGANWLNYLSQQQYEILSFSQSNNYYLIVSSSADMNHNLQVIADNKQIQNVNTILDLSNLLVQLTQTLAQKNRKPSIKAIHDAIKANIKPINMTTNSVESSEEQTEIKNKLITLFTNYAEKDPDVSEEINKWQVVFKDVINNVSFANAKSQAENHATVKFINLAYVFDPKSTGGSMADYAASCATRAVGNKLKIVNINNSYLLKLKRSIDNNALDNDKMRNQLNRYINAINKNA